MEERIRRKIEVVGSCWVWTASHDSKGYGQVRYGGKVRQAHRVVYTELVGPVPEGLELDHLCLVRDCVNPDHLEPVTRQENIARSVHYNASRTHCKWGHELVGNNLYVSPKNSRECKTCRRHRRQRYNQQKRVELDARQD